MRLFPEKITQDISKNVRPVYIVSGDEPLLVQESCEVIRDGLKKHGYSERELFHVEGRGFDWEQVLYSANSMSLFAEKKLLELRMSSPRPGDKGADALKAFVEAGAEDTVLLLVMPKVDKNIQRTKWFTTIEKAGGFLQVWPIDLDKLPSWIESRFRKVGLRASREAVVLLADRVEGNLLAAVQEIELLRLNVRDGEVSAVDVMENVADSARYDVGSLLDAALKGDAARVVRIVDGLRLESVQPLLVVGSLAWELRKLSTMAAVASQHGVQAAIKSGRVWDARRELVTNALRKHRVTDIDGMIAGLCEVDEAVKGLRDADPWHLLTDIALRLAGVSVIGGARR